MLDWPCNHLAFAREDHRLWHFSSGLVAGSVLVGTAVVATAASVTAATTAAIFIISVARVVMNRPIGDGDFILLSYGRVVMALFFMSLMLLLSIGLLLDL